MADDHIPRSYRATPQPPPRSAPGPQSGGDPLAELARLIGQTDPFAEYGRNGGGAQQQPGYAPVPAHDMHAAPGYDPRYPGRPQPADFPPPQGYPAHFAERARHEEPHAQQAYADPAYGQQGYGAEADYYPQQPVPGYAPPPLAPGYEQGPYYPNSASSEAEDADYYDDVPPRRRYGILAIAVVFALAVIGTAGAFGYRAIFGSSGSSKPPPIIKAEATPSKVVPAAKSKDPKSSKLIYDRVGSDGQVEKVVSREEQPVDRPVNSMFPQSSGGAQNTMMPQQPALGSGVVAVEPKKIHTITIRPDQAAVASGATASAAPKPPSAAHAAQSAPAPRQAVARADPPPRHATTAAPGNGPLSLSPDAQAGLPPPPARTAPPPAPRNVRTAAPAAPTQITPSAPGSVRTAAAAAPTQIAPPTVAAASSGGSGYAVQIASRHNESDAQASFRSLQAKYPQQLNGRSPLIRRVDLGDKGIYFRAMVGPLSSDEAGQLCQSLKAAGGQCIVQRI